MEMKISAERLTTILIEAMADEMLVNGNPNSDCALALDSLAREVFGEEDINDVYEAVALRCAEREKEEE